MNFLEFKRALRLLVDKSIKDKTDRTTFKRELDSISNKYFGKDELKNSILDAITKEYDFANARSLEKAEKDIINNLFKELDPAFAKTKNGIVRDVVNLINDGLKENEFSNKIQMRLEALIGKNRNYAYTITNTALAGYDQLSKTKDDPPNSIYRYVGPSPERPFCRAFIGKELTRKEIEKLSAEKGYDVFSMRGFHNCRHSWLWVGEGKAEKANNQNINESSNVNKIKPAETIAEANNNLKSRLGSNKEYPANVRYKHPKSVFNADGSVKNDLFLNTNLETLNIIDNKLSAFEERCNALGIPKIRAVHDIPIPKNNMTAVAGGTMGDGILSVNTWNQAPTTKEKSYSTSYGSKEQSLNSTLEHEFAHHIHQRTKGMEKEINEIYKSIGKKDVVHVSQYSKDVRDSNEWFAENYACYKTDRINECDKKLIEYFKNKGL